MVNCYSFLLFLSDFRFRMTVYLQIQYTLSISTLIILSLYDVQINIDQKALNYSILFLCGTQTVSEFGL